MAGHIATAAKTDWCTPPEIYLPVQKFFGEIDLDPCSNPKSGVPANVRLMLEKNENGLEKDWENYTTRAFFGTRVYCNPPYGRGIRAWVEKAKESTHYPGDVETILLIPAAVGTKLWQELVIPGASAICFVKGRIKFQGATASAPMDCALVYFGNNSEKFEDQFKSLGAVWNMVGECC